MRWLPPLVLCLSAACTERHLVGQLPKPDAGADAEVVPVTALSEAIVGHWCGPVRAPESDAPLGQFELEFRPDGTLCFSECDDCLWFLADVLWDGCDGRYRITDVTFDGFGWGRARGPVPRGGMITWDLNRVRVEGERLEFQMRSDEVPILRDVTDVTFEFELGECN